MRLFGTASRFPVGGGWRFVGGRVAGFEPANFVLTDVVNLCLLAKLRLAAYIKT